MKRLHTVIFLLVFIVLIIVGLILVLGLFIRGQNQIQVIPVAYNTPASYPTSLPKYVSLSEIYDSNLPTNTREESFVTVEIPDDQWPVGTSYVYESSNKRQQNKLIFVDSVYRLSGASQDGTYVYYWYSKYIESNRLGVTFKIYNTKTNKFIDTPYEYMGDELVSINKNRVVLIHSKKDQQTLTVIEINDNSYKELANIDVIQSGLIGLTKNGLSDNGWLYYYQYSPFADRSQKFFVNYNAPSENYSLEAITNNNPQFIAGSFAGWNKDTALFIDRKGVGMIDAASEFKITNRSLQYPSILEMNRGLYEYSFNEVELSPAKDSIYISLTKYDTKSSNFLLKVNLKGRTLNTVELVYRNEGLGREADTSRSSLKSSPLGKYILFTEIDTSLYFSDKVYFINKKEKRSLVSDNTYGTTWWKY